MTPPKPRNPSEIVGAITVRAEYIVQRSEFAFDRALQDVFDANRILDLCAELEQALLTQQLEASIERTTK